MPFRTLDHTSITFHHSVRIQAIFLWYAQYFLDFRSKIGDRKPLVFMYLPSAPGDYSSSLSEFKKFPLVFKSLQDGMNQVRGPDNESKIF